MCRTGQPGNLIEQAPVRVLLHLGGNHDVGLPPPSRNAGPRRRQPPQQTRRPQAVLPRLQIMDPAHPKTPFFPCQVPHCEEPTVMEEDVSRSFNISRTLRQNYIRWLPRGRHSCGCGSGWLAQWFFSRRALGGGQSEIVPRVAPSRPILRILARPQIRLHFLRRPSFPIDYQLHPFLPISRGLGCESSRRRRRRWFRWAADCRPSHVYWVPQALSEGRNGTFYPSIVVLARRYPLPEAHFDVVSRGRSFIDNGVGGGMFSNS